jgi:hypothetical protein
MKKGSFAAPGLILFILAAGAAPVEGQVCRLSIAGANDARRVMGPVHAECPGSIHSAPFGNWGVTSNFGRRRDGHQFDGWCHNTYYCDNWGNCKVDCRDGWYEWNSCTDISRYQQPNCSLYNSSDCTEQVTSTGFNVLGTVYLDAPVSCPYDSDEDGFCDVGGCMDMSSVTQASGFMSLYELDWSSGQLVQTVYFGAMTVNPPCDPWGCAGAGSEWVTPTFYDSPSWPPRVYAEMATALIWGAYSDPYNICSYYAQFDWRYACW